MNAESAPERDFDVSTFQFRIPPALKKEFFEACGLIDQRPAVVARWLVKQWLAKPAAEREPWGAR